MAVTTRQYNIATSRPKDVLQGLHDALTDLGWLEAQPFGYLCNFTNTPGSVLVGQSNARYLVSPSSTTAPSGTGAVFDVLRNPVGAISAVTLVTGGSGYYILGQISASSSGTTVTVPSTAGLNVGMLVNKLAGTGTLQSNTVITSIINSTQLTIDQAPSVALSAAALSFSDIIVLGASDLGGSSYSVSVTATSGSSTLTLSSINDAANIFIGQHITGTNIGALTTVTAISGTSITISKATLGAVSGTVTFSDEIVVTVTGTANTNNISGTASGLTITNVASNANIYVGAEVTLLSGTPTWNASNGRVIIGSISGTGPYTITLRNDENTFKGFDSTGNITFKVSSGNSVNWIVVDNFTAPQTYGWAIAKIKNGNGKLGSTFWHFYVGFNTGFYNGVNLLVRPLTGFNQLTNNAQGVSGLDWIGGAGATYVTSPHLSLNISSSAFVPLTLKTRQSGLDTNFCTFAFFEGNNNRNPFFISKYNTALQPWSLNDVFLGGITEIWQAPTFNTSDAGILFRQRMAAPKRMAEAGYGNYNTATALVATNTYFRTTTGNRQQATPVAAYDDVALYSRQLGDIQTSVTTTYPMYKSIPVNPHFMPVPYYLPDDFVLIEVPWMNPAILDTVTVSPSEVYTIGQVATNQTTFTAIAFAARTT